MGSNVLWPKLAVIPAQAGSVVICTQRKVDDPPSAVAERFRPAPE
jgi:hypothetical protein